MSPRRGFHLAVGLRTDQGPADGGHARFFGGLLDAIDGAAELVTIEDGFARPEGDGPDALILANWLGARTRRTGILAGAAVNVLEPFHVSTAIATLDYVTEGRAGLLVQPLRGEAFAAAQRAIGVLNGFPDAASLVEDRLEAVEVIRRLWDSWQDDAVIRDRESQRFLDAARLHPIRFRGERFSVLGPSITPRPPQGQPVVATTFEAGEDPANTVGADVVFLGAGEDALPALAGALWGASHRPLLFADVQVSFGAAGKGAAPSGAARNDASLRWTGDPAGLAAWAAERAERFGLAGLRFLPVHPAHDLPPLLAAIPPAPGGGAYGVSRTATPDGAPDAGTDTVGGPGETLRARLGLAPAPNRFVSAPAA